MTDLTNAAASLGREATAKARAFTENNPVAKKTKDVAFTAVGLGVLGVQKVTHAVKHVQSNVDAGGVSATVKTSVDTVTKSAKKSAAKVDASVTKTAKKVDEATAPLQEKLPAPVRDVASKAREAGSKVHASVTSKINAEEAK